MATSESGESAASQKGSGSQHEGGKESQRSGSCLPAGLAVALAGSWVLFGAYHFLLKPFQRQAMVLAAAGLVYRDGATVVVGDSISAALLPCRGVVNLAVPGMRAADLDLAHAEAIVRARPSRVVVMLGINDLRAGSDPKTIASATETFVRRVRAGLGDTTIVALGVLPIIENPVNGSATNENVRRFNAELRAAALAAGAAFADLGGLVGGDRLDPNLTPDGLHLNAVGQQMLADALFAGLVPPPGRTACVNK